MGYCCSKMGYDFHWPRFAKHPILTLPSGKRIRCNVRGFIPYISCRVDDAAEYAMPLKEFMAVHEGLMGRATKPKSETEDTTTIADSIELPGLPCRGSAGTSASESAPSRPVIPTPVATAIILTPGPTPGDDPPNLRYISGDILESTTGFIVHQCNCVTTSAAGIAKQIFKKFPQSNTYRRRTTQDKCDTPGTIDIKGRVINCYAQYYPSSAAERQCRRGPIPRSAGSADYDNVEARLSWFQSCLSKIESKFAEKDDVTLLFPHRIGCGLAGGDWEVYRAKIKDLALRKPSWSIQIWDPTHPQHCNPVAASHNVPEDRGGNATPDDNQDACWTNGPSAITHRVRRRSTMVDPNLVPSMTLKLPGARDGLGEGRLPPRSRTDSRAF